MDSDDLRRRAFEMLLADGSSLDGLCRAGVRKMPAMAGASVAVVNNVMHRQAMYATDEVARRLDDLQFELGEGPCIDAFAAGGPVLADDLTKTPARRWPAFTRAAVEVGAEAIFAFPLQVGAMKIGILDLYRTRPGTLTATELTESLVLSDALTMRLLTGQDGGGSEQDLGDDPTAVVHQATGMITVQIGIGVNESFARLRSYAYAAGRPLRDVAADVVARRLRFDELTD